MEVYMSEIIQDTNKLKSTANKVYENTLRIKLQTQLQSELTKYLNKHNLKFEEISFIIQSLTDSTHYRIEKLCSENNNLDQIYSLIDQYKAYRLNFINAQEFKGNKDKYVKDVNDTIQEIKKLCDSYTQDFTLCANKEIAMDTLVYNSQTWLCSIGVDKISKEKEELTKLLELSLYIQIFIKNTQDLEMLKTYIISQYTNISALMKQLRSDQSKLTSKIQN